MAHRILLKTGLLKLNVRHFIQKENPDILHFHLPNNAYIKFANPPQKCVLVHTIHSQPEKYWCTKKLYDRNDFKALNYLVHSHGTQLIALNDHARNVANQLLKEKLEEVKSSMVVQTIQNVRKHSGINQQVINVQYVEKIQQVKQLIKLNIYIVKMIFVQLS